jgi:hypothetical protein
MNAKTDRQTNTQNFRSAVCVWRQVGARKDRQTDGRTDGWMASQSDRRGEGMREAQIDRQMVGKTPFLWCSL